MMSPRRRSPRSGGSASFHYRVVSPRPSFTADDFYSLRASLSRQDSLLPVESTIEETDSEVIELPLSFDKSPSPERNVEKEQPEFAFAVKRKAIECLSEHCQDSKLINSIFGKFCKSFDEWNLQRQKVSVRRKGLAFVPPEELEAANEVAVRKWSDLCNELSKWSKPDASLNIPKDEPRRIEVSEVSGESCLAPVENTILSLDLAHVRVQKSIALSMEMEREMEELAQTMSECATVHTSLNT